MPDRRRSSTATRSLSSLFLRGSYIANNITVSAVSTNMESTDQKEDINKTLETLSSNSTKLSDLSQNDMIALCNELLHTIRSQSDEWSTAGDWIVHEMKLMKLISNDYDTNEEVIEDATVRTAASGARFNMGSIPGEFISTVIKGLQEEAAEIVEKKRNEKVHGPVSLGMAFPGHSLEVWTDESHSELKRDCNSKEEVEEEKKEQNGDKASHDNNNNSNGVALVLGAGNQSFLTLIDALQQCLLCRRTVLIKHHPIRPYLMAPFSILLQPLITRGYVAQILDGGIPHTTSILSDERIRHIHLTGSKATDKAVKETLRRSRPNLSEEEIEHMVTSELGCATPWIVSPGTYKPVEIKNAARMIAAAKKANGGCNCLSAQVIVLPSGWSGKNEFRKELMTALEGTTTNPSYYPGSRERRKDIVEHYTKRFGENNDRVTYTKSSTCAGQCTDEDEVAVIECGTVGEDEFDGTALIREAFGPVLAIVEIPGGSDDDAHNDNGEYMIKTVAPFLNDKTKNYGTLSCTLIAPDSQDKTETEQAVSSLNYGSVAVNSWSVSGYFSINVGGVWGAHPSDTQGQSGSGYIGNAYNIPHVNKGIVYGPSLSKEPLFTEKVPPAILLDAVHAVTCSTTTWRGMLQLWKLIVVRSISSVLMPVLGLVLGMRSRSSYGSAI